MPRIAGVVIPENKQIEIALTYIYGIGRSLSRDILLKAQINPWVKSSNLTQDEVKRIQEIIKEGDLEIEGDLRKSKMMAIKRLRDIGCWRGGRHARGLPARGQRTKTNTRTVRGNVRRTMGSGRKAAATPK